MGIIGRQGAKLTIANFLGVGIGFLSVIFIYPKDSALYGLMMFLYATGTLFEPLASLGIQAIILRYFSRFKDLDKTKHGLLLYSLLHISVGIVLFSILFWLFSGPISGLIQRLNPKDAENIDLFFNFIPVLVALLALQNLFNYYIANLHRIVIPGIILSILPKLWMPATFLLAYYQILDTSGIIYSVLGMVLVSVLALVFYLQSLGQLNLQPRWEFYPRATLQEMITYGLYGLLGIAGTQMAYRIDQSMLGTVLSMKAVGVFTFALTIATTIDMPARSVLNISAPLISDFFAKGEMGKIGEHYKKIALNLFSVGLFLYLGLVLVADDIFMLTGKPELLIARNIAMILGLAKLMDMLTGPNDMIIGISKYYRFSMLLIIALSLGNILLNYSFIRKYNVFGPAYASLVFIVAFNCIKVIFLWVKFKMLPFSRPMLFLAISALICIGIHYVLPSSGSIILDGLLGGIILLLGYLLPLVYWKLAPDLIAMLNGGLGSLGIKNPFK
ncbi:lipopolysaccharide biosynthesis protein [Haliscomenobacter sp.]|uniref:lipopolysaccharide biosynthesis protein n=1 Tax=Haliscomenobacter sp. TaxID=2717303 RepID=UPI0035936B11